MKVAIDLFFEVFDQQVVAAKVIEHRFESMGTALVFEAWLLRLDSQILKS